FLEKLDLTQKDGSSFARRPIRRLVYERVAAHFKLYDAPLAWLVEQPEFRVTGVKAVNRDAGEFVEIQFEYPHEMDRSSRDASAVQRGLMLLDMHHYWCVAKFDVDLQWSPTMKGDKETKHEYNLDASGFPILTRSHTINGRRGSYSGAISEAVDEYELHAASTLPPDKEFSLSAFGLPEPEGIRW